MSKDAVLQAFKQKYPEAPEFEAQFGIAYLEAQTGPLAPKLESMVEEIGYYRSMATTSAICFFVVVVFNLADQTHLPPVPWLPAFAVATALHAYRFRRFWRYVGEYVAGDVLRQSGTSSSAPQT